jgi:SOS-response transcriptional repressor LexA
MSNLAHQFIDAVAQNLRRLMNHNKVSEAELGRQTGVPQPTIHKILSGKTSDPRASTLRALANYFKISIDELVLGVELKRETLKTHTIPIISWTACINAPELLATINPSNWDKWVVTQPLSDSCFALISKPSMEPRFPIGTALVIDPTLQAEDGDIILTHYANTTEGTLREISIDGPTIHLNNLYGNTQPQELSPDIRLMGVLIRSIFSYHS